MTDTEWTTERYVELGQRLGIISARHGLDPEPETPMDHALQWARRGLCIFPCERFLGLPLVQKWHSAATCATSTIVEHWSTWQDADIAGVPDRSGHFVIVAVKEQYGDLSLMELEDELGELPVDFRYTNRWGDEHLWLTGSAMTSHHKLGRGLHVLGAGTYCYLPDSWAPCRVFK